MAGDGHNRHDEGIFNQLNCGAAVEERIAALFKPFSMTAWQFWLPSTHHERPFWRAPVSSLVCPTIWQSGKARDWLAR